MSDFAGIVLSMGLGGKLPSGLFSLSRIRSTVPFCPFCWIFGKALLQGYCQGQGESCLSSSVCPWLFHSFGACFSDPAG